jgi:hypothetical protein
MMQAGAISSDSVRLAAEPTPRAALLWLFLATALTGAGLVLARGTAALLLPLADNLALGFLPFLWYCRDSNRRNFQRTIWWNMGMVAMLVPTLFFYLWRSRPRGRRLRSILRALACIPLLMLAGGVGMLAAHLLSKVLA